MQFLFGYGLFSYWDWNVAVRKELHRSLQVVPQQPVNPVEGATIGAAQKSKDSLRRLLDLGFWSQLRIPYLQWIPGPTVLRCRVFGPPLTLLCHQSDRPRRSTHAPKSTSHLGFRVRVWWGSLFQPISHVVYKLCRTQTQRLNMCA